MRGHSRSDGLLGDYCDGCDFSHHPLYSVDPTSLQILLYYDDVEVCNPLGTKVKLHKLGISVRVFLILLYQFRTILLSTW